jgi:hypothetical protein
LKRSAKAVFAIASLCQRSYSNQGRDLLLLKDLSLRDAHRFRQFASLPVRNRFAKCVSKDRNDTVCVFGMFITFIALLSLTARQGCLTESRSVPFPFDGHFRNPVANHTALDEKRSA